MLSLDIEKEITGSLVQGFQEKIEKLKNQVLDKWQIARNAIHQAFQIIL